MGEAARRKKTEMTMRKGDAWKVVTPSKYVRWLVVNYGGRGANRTAKRQQKNQYRAHMMVATAITKRRDYLDKRKQQRVIAHRSIATR